MSDIDDVIAMNVNNIWGTKGALDKEETKFFMKDVLKEMADGDDNDEFSEEDFNKCFKEFDKDSSGALDDEEFVKVDLILNLPLSLSHI